MLEPKLFLALLLATTPAAVEMATESAGGTDLLTLISRHADFAMTLACVVWFVRYLMAERTDERARQRERLAVMLKRAEDAEERERTAIARERALLVNAAGLRLADQTQQSHSAS